MNNVSPIGYGLLMATTHAPSLPDGLVAFVKRDCPTCALVVPALEQLVAGPGVTILTQDDPNFPPSLAPVHDTDLSMSWHHDIETVPTLVRVENGVETDRTVGWSRADWERISGVDELAPELADLRPGCGSLSVDPLRVDELMVRFTGSTLTARRIELAAMEDEMEAGFDRGWSDGLPIVPPTEARVLRMLEGTTRAPTDIVATVPPDLNDVTVEQVAINAVMAGCKPEYLPVVLTAVEGACSDAFNMHGLLATTYFSGPIIVVNGPIAKRIGMNAGGNVLGQGNRANMTIGRALQLVVRNLGGGRPGGVDMAMHGAPSKLGLAFAELEDSSPFEPLSVERGLPPGTDAVTIFAGQGPTPIVDQLSRDPDSLARSMATVLRACHHSKLAIGMDALLLVSPEHARIFAEAGWDKGRLRSELESLLMLDADPMLRGAGGIAEGLPESLAGATVPKFRPGGLLIAHAGGDAGLFSSVLTGWVGGPMGSEPVTLEITR